MSARIIAPKHLTDRAARLPSMTTPAAIAWLLQARHGVTQLALASTSRRAIALLNPDPLQPIRTLEWLLACLYPTQKRRA